MDYQRIKERLIEIVTFMDDHIHNLGMVTKGMQKSILETLTNGVTRFDANEGNLIATQDYRRNILSIETQISGLLASEPYKNAIIAFLNAFESIQKMNISLQADANAIKVPNNILNPSRLLIYENAKNALVDAIHSYFVQPVKMLLLNQVVKGAGVDQTIRMLKGWDEEGITKIPNLEQYVTQTAQDSMYGVHRNINNIIKDKYNMTTFIYVGGIIKDTRPFCRHLVEIDRKIKLSEIPPLVKLYPDGLYPDTTQKNFMQVCGGYNCRHQALAVLQD